ncbi:MAG: hypothetical protein GEV12_16040, partial [Micromonosporaceae bacterium]|nr:hypothetical protein [Micromonosporaceae bacterium]
MPGLAATLGAAAPAAAEAIADALAVRGRDAAAWRAGSAHLVVRAAMPAVHEFPDGALLLDGDAAPSTLAAGYARHGPAALLPGDATAQGRPGDAAARPASAYTVVLADLARDALVLARHGDGPPLYWARHGPAVLVASEPAGLFAAGVPTEPDPAVVERFLATGACDDSTATFFARVRRVLPGQLVEVTRDRGSATARVHEPTPTPYADAATALAAADLSGRVGVRLGCGIGAAAVLGATLARPGRPRPLPVYSTTFPELATVDSSAYCAAALLGPYALGAARHRALPFFADEIDVDAYLTDLGEPTPELADWLRWATARRIAGEVDALVDAAAGAHLGRLADRVTSRFGVGLRVPLRDVPEPARRAALAGLVQRMLPSAAAGFALAPAAGRGADALLADLLRRMRTELVTTFLHPRFLHPRGAPIPGRLGGLGGLAEVLALLAGDRVDVPALWRRYLVQRWLRCVVEPAPGVSRVPTAPRAPAPVTVAGRAWSRLPVRTELLASGDKLPEKVAWYVGEAVPAPAGRPWFVLLAAKPAAVMQGRARSLWEIRPRLTARALARLPGQQDQSLATPWVLQVAIEEVGWWRVVAAAIAGAAGRRRWYAHLAGPAVRAVR